MDKTAKAVSIFNQFAKEYQNKFMDQELYHQSFDLFCTHIPRQNAEILELACGPGNITRYLLQKRPDFQVFGIDLSPNMVQLAQTNNPSATFQVMDAREITSLNKKYDAVMCGFCFPYLSKEEAIQMITDVSSILNTGGIFYISTMEDDYSKSGLQTTSAGQTIYLHYHQADYLEEALKANGFEIVSLQRQDFPEPDGKKTVDLIIVAEKK